MDSPDAPAPNPADASGSPSTPEPAAGKGKRPPRRHPYAHEASTERERALDARKVTLFWGGLATALTLGGILLARRYSPVLTPTGLASWGAWTEVALFGGLGLLGFGFLARTWARRMTMAGWLLFAFYWALVAQDLFVAENGDYVNMFFAFVGTYFFTYLAYHQWLSEVRGVENPTVRFVNIGTFVAAGAYFLIDKIQPLRLWLILTVSDHTKWLLDLFGQGAAAGLHYEVDLSAPTSDVSGLGEQAPTLFWYDGWRGHIPAAPHGFWATVMHFDPTGADPTILPVSIILACTALQSIMLFVGLFMGTDAPWRKKVWASVLVAGIVYALNLLRNTGIIWFYGQGQASFWMMHDAVGKGGSLIAMVAIAFACFAWFPEFLKGLIGVLDLPHRDGPVERVLRLGQRRPGPPSMPPAPPG
jgi:archaeosortase A (PGF-CTERM-specific)